MWGAGVGRLHALYRPQESPGEQRARRMPQTYRVLYDGLIAILVRKPLAHLDNRPAVWNRAPNTWMAYRAHAFKRELRPSAWIGQRRLHYKDWFRNPSSLAASACPRPMIAAGACACAGSRSGSALLGAAEARTDARACAGSWSGCFPRRQSPRVTVGFMGWRKTCWKDGFVALLAVKRVSE